MQVTNENGNGSAKKHSFFKCEECCHNLYYYLVLLCRQQMYYSYCGKGLSGEVVIERCVWVGMAYYLNVTVLLVLVDYMKSTKIEHKNITKMGKGKTM